jgi:hypothetical protein
MGRKGNKLQGAALYLSCPAGQEIYILLRGLKVSLPYSQQPLSGSSFKPDESYPHNLVTYMLNIHSNIILSSAPLSPEVGSYIHVFQLKLCTHFLNKENTNK